MEIGVADKKYDGVLGIQKIERLFKSVIGGTLCAINPMG